MSRETMNGQSLACSASSSRTAAVPARPAAATTSSSARARGERHVGDRGARPRREVAARCPSCTAARRSPRPPARPRSPAPARRGRARRRGAPARGPGARTPPPPPPATRAPRTTSGRAARCRARRPPARPRPRPLSPSAPASRSRAIVRATKSAGVLARERERRLVVVGLAGVVPRVVVVDGVVVVVAVGARGGVAAVAPDERDRRAVDRHEPHARLGGDRAQVLGRARARSGRSARRTPRARRRPRAPARATARTRTRAARSRRASSSPKRPRCAFTPVCTCRRTPASVASSGRIAWVAEEVHCACGASAPSRSPPRRVEALERALVVAPRALELARELARARRRAARPRPARGCRGARRSMNAAKRSRRSGRLELVAQHRRQRQRQRRAVVEQVEQRQVAAGDRLPQPLLAERPGAEALDVGHVRVQDDRQRAALAAVRSRPAHREEVERPVEVGLARGAQREVGRGDRRREPAVERLA